MLSQFALLGLGTWELLLILAIILVLFGGKKLPELSRNLGESMQEMRKGLKSGNAKKTDKDEKHSEVA